MRASPSFGRGSASNRSGRFEPLSHEDFDDGWSLEDDGAKPPRTSVSEDAAKTVITRNASPDLPFDRSINPYRGCEHGCSYCFARPTHAYLGLSPGLDFETKLFAKQNAATLLRRELAHPRYKPKPLALGTNTDPYQPIERDLGITRAVLTTLSECGHPLTIVTKSNLVVRDIDILAPMAAKGLARVAVSVTTLDRHLARAMEPRAPTPEKRLEAVRLLRDAGIPTAVMVAPVVPGLTDMEIEAILERAKRAGADSAGYILLRMPHEIKDLFREWLAIAAPDRADRVISLMRQMRGGKDYDSAWRRRQTGTGPLAALISKRFKLAARRLGLDAPRLPLDTSQFRPPRDDNGQLSLFTEA